MLALNGLSNSFDILHSTNHENDNNRSICITCLKLTPRTEQLKLLTSLRQVN